MPPLILDLTNCKNAQHGNVHDRRISTLFFFPFFLNKSPQLKRVEFKNLS